METRSFRPGPWDDQVRLDAYLAKEHAAPSRSFLRRLIDQGMVRVNGRHEKASYRVRPGDLISVSIPQPEPETVEPEEIDLDIIYEDAGLLVLNKPRGMVVHPGAGRHSGTLVNALLARCKDLSGIGGVVRPGIVHRLDRDTSGVMVVAKNDSVHLRLAADLASRKVTREYVAIVRGNISEDDGVIDAPIGRHPVDRKRQAVRADGRRAVTRFHVEQRFGDYTLVRVVLETGRTHQIRVHMQYISRPVAGDPIYGGVRGELGLHAQALHAESLEFTHPETGERKRFEAPMPEDMKSALAKLRARRKGGSQ